MSAREEFWGLVCSHASQFYLLLLFVTVMAVLNLFAMLLGEQSEGAYVVSLVVFAILAITGVGIALLLWRCRQRRRRRR